MEVTRPVLPFDAMTVPLDSGVTLVEASAGTGKTFAATRLVLRLLLERRVERLSQILVVTFTEKAAQELVTRIRGALRDADKIWSATPPPRDARNDDLFTLREQHSADGGGIIRGALASLDDLGVSTIHGFCNRVLTESALESRVHFTSTFLDDDSEPLRRAAHDWARRRLVPDDAAAAIVAGSGADPADWVGPLVRPFRRSLNARIDAAADPAGPAQLLQDFVLDVNATFENEKARRHLMGYDDLLAKLHTVLTEEGPDGPLSRRIREHFAAAIIDEFQDTDPIQYPIFATAFAGCPLFLIGDPKQSIYSFRGADVHAYLRAAAGAGSHHTLDKNYRSTDHMVRAVQALFRYRPRPFRFNENQIGLPSVRAAGGVEVPAPLELDGRRALEWVWAGEEHHTSRGGISKEAAQRLAVRAVTAEIVRLRASAVPGKSIAVLVRRNVEALAMKHALDDARIAAVVGSDGDVLESDEAAELLLLAAAVADPRDGWAVRAAMSTRLWGSDAGEIAAASRGENERAWSEVTGSFSNARDLWNARGVAVALTSLLAERSATERLLALPDGERRLTNIRQLIELFQDAATTESLAPDAFLAWAERERAIVNTPERRQMRLESDSEAVQILTIHKAKGLQWPVVFCPTLWREPADRDPPLGVPVSLTIGDGDDRAVLDLDSPQSSERLQRAEEESLAEELRMAYVALTRAESRCYVVWGSMLGAARSALGWLLRSEAGDSGAPGAALVTEQALTELVELNLGTMAVRAIGEYVTHETAPTERDELPALAARTFTPAPAQFDVWLKSSYSGLTSGAHESDARDMLDAPLVAAERVRAGDVRGFRGFPAGTTAGTALHALFERLDFPQVAALTDEQVADTLREFGIAPPGNRRWELRDVREMLAHVCAGTIPGAGFALAQVPMAASRREWRFTLAVKHFSVAAVAGALERHGSAHARAYAPYLRTLDRDAFRGYLTGSVDLAFQHDARWYVMDWKSNWLGAEDADYRPEALDAVMHELHYTLQYHIYLVALHRHLRVRQPGYDPARHWGSVGYAFLRGIGGAGGASGGASGGWFTDVPTPELLDALDHALVGRS